MQDELGVLWQPKIPFLSLHILTCKMKTFLMIPKARSRFNIFSSSTEERIDANILTLPLMFPDPWDEFEMRSHHLFWGFVCVLESSCVVSAQGVAWEHRVTIAGLQESLLTTRDKDCEWSKDAVSPAPKTYDSWCPQTWVLKWRAGTVLEKLSPDPYAASRSVSLSPMPSLHSPKHLTTPENRPASS